MFRFTEIATSNKDGMETEDGIEMEDTAGTVFPERDTEAPLPDTPDSGRL